MQADADRGALIPDAGRAWRFLSVQVAAVGVAFGLLPADIQAAMLDWVGVPASRIPAVLGVMMILGRLKAQS